MKIESILTAVLIAAVALAALMFAAPFSAPYGAYTHLDGAIGIMDHHWGISFPDAVYALGDIACHQKYGRSVILNGSQMPLCARCAFAVPGIALGASLLLLRKGIGARIALIAGIILIAPVAADWAVQAHLGAAFLPSLALTGMSGGAGLSLLLYAYLMYDIEEEVRGQGQRP